MSERWSSAEITLAAGVALLVAVFLGFAFSSPERGATADTWRRTADGWERVGDWRPAAPRARESLDQSRHVPETLPRLDTHPAVLALAQLVAVLLTLAWRPKRASMPANWLETLPAAISRSFRASIFGS